MIHKKLISLLVLLTVAISGAWADDTKTLTVHDGFSTNSFVPFWGKLVNKYTRSEMIYPATELAGMKGGDIKSLTFYKSGFSDTGSWGTAYFQIYLKEVSSTALSAYIGMTDATVVYQGGVGIADGERPVTIDFNTPYHYNGGNLLVGIYQTDKGNSSDAYFYGEVVTGASSSGSNNTNPANAGFTQHNFLPKTTFTYKPAPPDYVFTVADSEHGSGTVSFTVQDKDDAENVKQNATRANEGDLVTMTITPDASWVVDAENVKAQTYTTWGAAGAPRRIAANNIQILGDVTFTSTSYNETTGVYTCTFTMPSANVLVSTAYKKMGTLYFDPADKTDLMEVKVGDEVKAPANGKLRRILEGTPVKLTANKGYQLRKVVVKKGMPTPTFAANEYNEASWDGTNKKVVLTKKTATSPTVVTSSDGDVTWGDGWYTVSGDVTINGSVKLNADTHLILQDYATLTINGKINGDAGYDDYNLSIYGQAIGNGELIVTSSSDYTPAFQRISILEIHGGVITASDDNTTYGMFALSGRGIRVYGGKVTASSVKGNPIYYGYQGMEVYGGNVTATTGSYFAIVGAESQTLIVYGGKVKASAGDRDGAKAFDVKVQSGTDAIKFYFSNDEASMGEGEYYPDATDAPEKRFAKAE